MMVMLVSLQGGGEWFGCKGRGWVALGIKLWIFCLTGPTLTNQAHICPQMPSEDYKDWTTGICAPPIYQWFFSWFSGFPPYAKINF